MAVTYEPLASTTLASAAASITISSIPATYTDLRVVCSLKYETTTSATLMRFNSDSGSNYSYTYLYSTGNAASGTSTSGAETRILVDHNQGLSATQFSTYEMDIFSYASSQYKMLMDKLSRDSNGSGVVSRSTRCWQNTAALNSIYMYRNDGNNFAAGTSMTIWGILKA